MNVSTGSHHDEHPAELISGVLADAREYAVAEVDKLKAETIIKAKEIGEEVKIISVGLLIFTVAAIMFGAALSLALVAAGLPGWAGFGIVAIVFGGIGVVFLSRRDALAKAAVAPPHKA
jgi:multidrug transporter EmrE-like cation transporter